MLRFVQRVDGEGVEYYGSSDDEDPMDVVHCMECGSGDDESHLLLCDGAGHCPPIICHFLFNDFWHCADS